MIALSPDEQRIVRLLTKWAEAYERRGQRNPFTFDRVKGALLRVVIQQISEGAHR